MGVQPLSSSRGRVGAGMEAASLADEKSDLGPAAIAAVVAAVYLLAKSVPVTDPPLAPPALVDFLAAGGGFPSDDAPDIYA